QRRARLARRLHSVARRLARSQPVRGARGERRLPALRPALAGACEARAQPRARPSRCRGDARLRSRRARPASRGVRGDRGRPPRVSGDRPAQLPRARRGGGVVSHEVKLSSPDRVLFPDDGITKGDLFDYYGKMAPAILPHLRDRPFTMKRWREGLPGGSFFQKQAPKGMPEWIPTRQFRTYQREGGTRLVDFPLVNSRDALLWMVQMHSIHMNAWYPPVDKPERPDYVVFHLDPPDGPDGFPQAIRVAHLIRGALERFELAGYVKTSGADGIHILVPIARRYGFHETYEFAELLSQ